MDAQHNNSGTFFPRHVPQNKT